MVIPVSFSQVADNTRLLSTSIEARRRPRRSACNRPQSAAAQCSERKTKTSVSHRTDETEVNAILEDGYSRVNEPPATECSCPIATLKPTDPIPIAIPIGRGRDLIPIGRGRDLIPIGRRPIGRSRDLIPISPRSQQVAIALRMHSIVSRSQ